MLIYVCLFFGFLVFLIVEKFLKVYRVFYSKGILLMVVLENEDNDILWCVNYDIFFF